MIPTNSQTKESIKEKYTTQHTLRNGAKVVFRPIECTDQARFKAFFHSLSPSSIHFRFFEMIKDLPNETVEKYCDIDFSREMAIVALPQDEDGIVGVVRLEIDGGRRHGEFALVVADAWQGLGLGEKLTRYVVEIAHGYGLVEVHCFVSSDNVRMIGLAEKLGFKVKSSDGDTVELALQLT